MCFSIAIGSTCNCAIGITAFRRVATLATRGRNGQGNAQICGLFQPLPLAGLPLSRFTRRGRKDYSTAYVGIKGNLLLLCVAEQYRGAVEPSETEGLEKSTRIFTTFTPMLRNRIVPLAIRLFVESRRSRLVAGTDKKTASLRSFSTPSPCGTSPISFHSQGQKRLLYGLREHKR